MIGPSSGLLLPEPPLPVQVCIRPVGQHLGEGSRQIQGVAGRASVHGLPGKRRGASRFRNRSPGPLSANPNVFALCTSETGRPSATSKLPRVQTSMHDPPRARPCASGAEAFLGRSFGSRASSGPNLSEDVLADAYQICIPGKHLLPSIVYNLDVLRIRRGERDRYPGL